MSVRLVDMDARCKYHDKNKKKIRRTLVVYRHSGDNYVWKEVSLSLSLSLSLTHTHTHTWKCKKLRMEIS